MNSIIFCLHGLLVCFKLVAHKITQIFHCCKVDKTHLVLSTSQIKTKRIFSIARILTLFCRYYFLIENLDKLIFVNNNLPFDLCINHWKHVNLTMYAKHNSTWKKTWGWIWWRNGMKGIPKKIFIWFIFLTTQQKVYHYGFAFEILFWATFFLGG
jgi:hypothetical protein